MVMYDRLLYLFFFDIFSMVFIVIKYWDVDVKVFWWGYLSINIIVGIREIFFILRLVLKTII